MPPEQTTLHLYQVVVEGLTVALGFALAAPMLVYVVLLGELSHSYVWLPEMVIPVKPNVTGDPGQDWPAGVTVATPPAAGLVQGVSGSTFTVKSVI